jgi:hypothetical protein
MVNASTSPAAVVSGDGMWVAVRGVPAATGVKITLEDGSGTVYNLTSFGNPAPTNLDIVLFLTQLNQVFEFLEPLQTPGAYYVRMYFDTTGNTIQGQVPLTVNPYVNTPFPLIDGHLNPNGLELAAVRISAATGGTILAGAPNVPASGVCVRGNIVVSSVFEGPAGNPSTPQNTTMQYYAVSGDGIYHPLGSPVFAATGGPTVASFDTTALADGSYVITAKIVDMNDVFHGDLGGRWTAPLVVVLPQPVIIQNGPSPMDPTGTYMIPAAYNNPRTVSPTPDFLKYQGLPAAARSYPYPAANVPPVWNPSSPFHGNPVSARRPPLGMWFEGVNGIRTNEYYDSMEWRTTNAGGIFAESFFSKTTANGSIEGSYPAVAQGSYRDGGRNTNPTTSFVTFVAAPPTGPWSQASTLSYHWTLIQEDGRLAVMSLAGDMVTIAGYKRDLTKLPIDWKDPANAEFPNTVQIGTIDTNPLYTFSDFGGGAADCCWDPRDPYICYVSQTVDHCIIKVNFHTQTLGGVKYGPSNPLCQRYAGYKGGVLGDGNGGYVDGVALSTGGSGAQFNGVYSLCMMKRTDNTAYPQGTMFVADNYNGLIRVISAGALDSNGNQATPSTVSTLVGLHGGTTPQPPNFQNTLSGATAPIAVSSISLSGTTATVTLAASPVSGIQANGWKITLLNNGSPYYDGNGSIYEHTFGIYTLTSFTDSTHFQIGPIASLPTGTVTITVAAADTYSRPDQVAFSSPNAYIAYPNTIRMSSKGHLVVLEAWYNSMARVCWLSGPNANTITRVGPFGNLATYFQPEVFGWMDVDDAVTSTAGSFTDPGIGACGPQDDIVLFKVDSNPGSASVNDRWSFDGTFNYFTTYDGTGFFGDGGPNFPSEGPGGAGHYPWAFCFSKTQFRMLSCGLDPTGFFQWRPKQSSDPDESTDLIGGQGLFYPYLFADTGWQVFQHGTRGIFPLGFRPSFATIFGAAGLALYGQNTAPTLDDLPMLYPNDYSGPSGTVLATYITDGMAGQVPRLELSMDDDGVTPGRPLAAYVYFIKRQSMSGSWPNQTPPLFTNQDIRGGSQALITPGTWSLNYIRPKITVQAGDPTRVSNTSIRVRWTTDKSTLGIVIAGTPNSATTPWTGTPTLYNLWTTLEMDNGGVWGTTHDVTITGLPDASVTPPSGSNAPNNVAVLVIDRAGNWNVSANFVVPSTRSTVSPDGSILFAGPDPVNPPAIGATSVSIFSGSISGTTLTVGTVNYGAVAVGQILTDGGAGFIASGTKVLSGSGTSWQVNISQSVTSETLYGTLPASGPLWTKYGAWDFGNQWAGPGSQDQNYRFPRLNGKEIVYPGAVEGNNLVGQVLQVDTGGNLWLLQFSLLWSVWDNYNWLKTGPTGWPFPGAGALVPDPTPTYTPPYTPSADGTMITGGTGTVVTSDGVWSFGAFDSGSGGWLLMLNGIPVGAGSTGGGFGYTGGAIPVSEILVDSYGQLYAKPAGGYGNGYWMRWVAGALQLNPEWPNGPGTLPAHLLPVPIDMTFNPPCPVLHLSSAPGTFLTTVVVTMSDGSSFAGTYVVGANQSNQTWGAMSGNNLVVGSGGVANPNGANFFPITATQNGWSITNQINWLQQLP